MKFITKLSIGAAAILAAISMWSFASAANLATNLTWCTTNSGTINVSYQECNSLAYLFDETSGMNRTHNDNWLSNTDLTTRVTPGDGTTGALTIAGGHITGMSLMYGNLFGSISSGLLNLPYLTHLNLFGNSINFVNLSQNTGLIYLDVRSNTMSGVNLTMLTGLKVLSVGSSNMTNVNLSQNINLRQVLVYGVNNSWVDFSANTLLTGVSIAAMPLTGLDFRANTQLLEIEASYNSGHMIQTINVSGLTLLKTLHAVHGGVRYIDLSTNTALEGLSFDNSFLTGINLSGLSNLKNLGLYMNSLSSIDISRNPRLENVYLASQSGGNFSGINISQNTGLLSLSLENNPISSFTVASNSLYSGALVVYLSGNVLNPSSLDINTLWFLHDHYSAWGYKGFPGPGEQIVVTKDNCPNGDTSTTEYDGLCSGTSSSNGAAAGGGGGGGSSSTQATTTATGTVVATTGQVVTTGTVQVGTVVSNTQPASEKDIYNWAFANHITTLSVARARLHDGILRYEAAKMIVNFAQNVMHSQIPHNPLCDTSKFSDAASFDAEMTENITKICDLGLMGWSIRNEKLLTAFRPFYTLSAGDFGIVIGRYLGQSPSAPTSSQRVDIMRFLFSVSAQ